MDFYAAVYRSMVIQIYAPFSKFSFYGSVLQEVTGQEWILLKNFSSALSNRCLVVRLLLICSQYSREILQIPITLMQSVSIRGMLKCVLHLPFLHRNKQRNEVIRHSWHSLYSS